MTINSSGAEQGHVGVNGDDQFPKPSTSMPIAIVGMGCRFAGSISSPERLWDLCASGKDCWSPVPKDRFNSKSLYSSEAGKRGRFNVKGGYFFDEDISLFDAAFFGFSEEMAKSMDPQLRLLLEVVYEATENAGIPIEKLRGSNTSVFSGLFSHDYYDSIMRDPEYLTPSFVPGTGTAMYANRISHFFDFHGPSVALDTGCSSGTVSLNHGIRSLQNGEAEISIVTGASALLNQDFFVAISMTGILGVEGKCFAWDHRAEGYGRAEGIAALVLKPLDAALRDGDFVHAVIRESVVNQDGNTPTITTPSMTAQVKAIEECYRRAGLNISDTAYVEGHMTGTGAGDPIEAEAIARTFGKSRPADDPILVASVKSNIGHTEAVSGIAAVIKTVYALKHQLIPAHLNYEKPNPKIPLKDWHLKVPTTLTPWPKNKPLRASINNFGYGGTNTHLILEAAPATTTNETPNGRHSETDPPRIFLLSAKDTTVLEAMTKNLGAYARQQASSEHIDEAQLLGNLAYTLSERRSRFPYARALTARSYKGLAERLEGAAAKPTWADKPPRIAYVFNGQGAQWFAMGRELITAYPVYGSSVQKATQLFKEFGATWSLQDELLRDEESTRVHETKLGQPICVALQICLVDLLSSWGIAPSSIASHSSGEIAAAYAAGALSFKEALGVAYYRSAFAVSDEGSAPSGGMLAASLDREKAEEYVAGVREGRAVVACINSPGSVTLSGDLSAINELSARLDEDGIFQRKLKVPTAYHSHHMEPLAKPYLEALRKVIRPWQTLNGGVVYASPVSGAILTNPKELGPEHWVANMTQPVLFAQAFDNACFDSATAAKAGAASANVDFVVEIGPHATLRGPVQQILKARSTTLPYASCLKRGVNAVETMQDLASTLLENGYPVKLPAVNSPFDETEQTFVNDLPSYPWNHTVGYWLEPAITRSMRHTPLLPHELLGTPLHSGSATLRSWRNLIQTSNMPWLREHLVDEQIVLPGASYVSMAIEAIRMITDPSEETIQGYRLRDIDITSALIVPDSSSGIEVQFSLQPCSARELDHDGWYEFKICSVASEETVIDHCTGLIAIESVSTQPKAATYYEGTGPTESSFFPADAQAQDVDIESLFRDLRKMNIFHGPIFQNLESSRMVSKKAITSFALSEVSDRNAYVLHPTTLDSIFQSCYGPVSPEVRNSGLMVPRSINNMYIPQSLRKGGDDGLVSFTELLEEAKTGVLADIHVGDRHSDGAASSFLSIEGLYLKAIPRNSDAIQGAELSRSRWELDILHEVPASVKDPMRKHLDTHAQEWEQQVIGVSYFYIEEALKQLEGCDDSKWERHHKVFHNWMKSVSAAGRSGALGPNCQSVLKKSKGAMQMLADEIASANSTGQMIRRVGEHLASIVRGEVTPLELMMEQNLLLRFYSDSPRLQRHYSHISALIEHFATKNPGANVLEVGGGSAGVTLPILNAFASGAASEGGRTLLGRYTFTDISAGFFNSAKEKLSAWTDLIDFETFDAERDPADQGLKAGTYDLVVAYCVLHATASLEKTLSNVRKLLRPGGKLLVAEVTRDTIDGQMIFGTLPGWWLGEADGRTESPNVSLERWDKALRASGFTGVDFNIGDCEEPDFQTTDVFLTTATSKSQYPTDITLVYYQKAPPEAWVKELDESIYRLSGSHLAVESLSQVQGNDKICIFTADMEMPFLEKMDAVAFGQLRSLLMSCQGLLWLSCGSLIESEHPLYAQTQGFLRTMRQEDGTKRFIHLDFEQGLELWASDQVRHVAHVFDQSFDLERASFSFEMEYAVKDDMLHVLRVMPLAPEDNPINPNPVAEQQPFLQPGRPLVWETSKNHTLSDIYFVDALDVTGDLSSGMIEIEPKAYGVKFRDLVEALGTYEAALISHEASGIITKLGPGTEDSGFHVGDRVCGDFPGRFASRVRTHWTYAVKIPDELPYEEACGYPSVNTTAFHALYDVAQLRAGEKVLIHAATGGVGQAAVILAQHIGAEVYATCSSDAKRQLLIDKYQIDPDHILSSRDTSFRTAILAKTGGKGVDVVLNSRVGPLLKATVDCVGRFGRFVELGLTDAEAGKFLDMKPFARSITFAAFDLQMMAVHQISRYRDLLERCLRTWNENRLRPVHPINAYPMSEMEAALRPMAEGKHVGKIVLVPGPELVKVVTRTRPLSLDEPNSTYLIVGGLGGIGRALAVRMVERGAKNILVISRNAASHPEAGPIKQLAAQNGCNFQVANCDVSDEASFLGLLKSLDMPPIRGVITGAMVLDDSIMEHMEFDQWVHAARPKIAGTLNLHNHLPDLSFFIMLSSVNGIVGNVSQANYAAGNTFQDALAHHRVRHGLPASVLDLGVVGSVGFVAESSAAQRERILKIQGSIELEEVLALIEHGIRNPLPKNAADTQIVSGVLTGPRLAADATVRKDMRFSTLLQASRVGGSGDLDGSAGAAANASAMLQRALLKGDSVEAVTEALVAKLAEMLPSVTTDSVDPKRSMISYGVDSLVAVELRNWIRGTVDTRVSIFEITQSPSISSMAALLVEKKLAAASAE